MSAWGIVETAALSNLGQTALSYARKSWAVFPCEERGKKPLCEHGFQDASTDEETIRDWWTRWPDSNIAHPTGHEIVLDVDGPEGGAALAALEQQHAALPETLTVRTGRGRHLYFSSNGTPLRNSVEKLGPHFDIRGKGGYVILPPSIHSSGARYEWKVKKQVAPLPEWIAAALAEGANPQSDHSATGKKIPQGQRHKHLLKLAGLLHSRGCEEDSITALLLAENASRCDPPEAESEVCALAHDVCTRYPGGASADRPLEWPEPEPLGDDLLPVPPFDTMMLPEAFREHVEDFAERMQVPIDLPAVCAVACLAGVVNRRAVIQPKREDVGWVVTPNLWAGIVAPPGQMKSNILGHFTGLLARIESRWRSEHESELGDYEAWEEERGLRGQAWREQYKLAVKNGTPPPDRPVDSRAKPRLRRLIANDPTVEALHEILSDNPAGVLLVRDELAGWLAALDKHGREGDRQFFLESWLGDVPFTMDRIARGTIHVPALCLSILGGIQPGRLRQYLVDAVRDGPGNDGLFQRFQLVAWPDFPKSWTLVDRLPNQRAAERAERVYGRLAELPADQPMRLRFADGAQELFYEWWTELERKIRGGDLPPALTAHLGKYRSLMPSLALLFELADREDFDGPREVSLSHAQQAAALCDYLEAHAHRIYGCIVSPELHAARELADKLKQGRLPAEFSTREVYQKGWSGLGTHDEARAALRVLEDAGWVRQIAGENREGRPSEQWQVNPCIAEVK